MARKSATVATKNACGSESTRFSNALQGSVSSLKKCIKRFTLLFISIDTFNRSSHAVFKVREISLVVKSRTMCSSLQLLAPRIQCKTNKVCTVGGSARYEIFHAG